MKNYDVALRMSKELGIPIIKAWDVLHSFEDIVTKNLVNGENVLILGFGNFTVKTTPQGNKSPQFKYFFKLPPKKI